MIITELTQEQIDAVKKANDILEAVGLALLEVGAPKPPRP